MENRESTLFKSNTIIRQRSAIKEIPPQQKV